MKRIWPWSLLLLPLLMLPMAASAWSAFGHRLVADLAATELTPQARAQVADLLRGEADPTLAGVATWADELRENDPDLGKRSASWHYVNMPEGTCNYIPARDCRNGDCVIGAIERQAAILADRKRSRAERAQALKFVVHFVGDVHQPMHVGLGRDRGGNDVQVNLDGKGMNLHSLWDRELLAARGLQQQDHVRHLARQSVDDIAPGDVRTWARESCELRTSPGLYPPRARIESGYVERWQPLAERRVRVAAHRLAHLLNETLAD